MEDPQSEVATKATYIEKREMAKNMKCHELIRMFMNIIYDFMVRGDPTWVVRRCRDEASMMVRRLHEAYNPLFTQDYVDANTDPVRAGTASVSFCSTRIYTLVQVSLLLLLMMMTMRMTMMMMMVTTTTMMIMMMGWWWW